MMGAIQFTRCYYTFSQVSSLIVNGKIIEEREGESSGHVLHEIVCNMRYREGDFCSTSVVVFYIPIEPHA